MEPLAGYLKVWGGFLGASPGPFGGLARPIGSLLGALWSLLGPLGNYGGPVKAFWSLLGGSPGLVEGLLGASWNPFGISWQLLGGVLGYFSMRLGASWGLIGGLSSPSEAKRREGKLSWRRTQPYAIVNHALWVPLSVGLPMGPRNAALGWGTACELRHWGGPSVELLMGP